jgi:ABC-type cobalamin transport system ATPase subunit
LILDGKTLVTGRPGEVLTPYNLEHAYGITLSPDSGSVSDAFALTWKIKQP